MALRLHTSARHARSMLQWAWLVSACIPTTAISQSSSARPPGPVRLGTEMVVPADCMAQSHGAHGGHGLMFNEHQAALALVSGGSGLRSQTTNWALGGKWSDASSWAHGVPSKIDRVCIPAGVTIILD